MPCCGPSCNANPPPPIARGSEPPRAARGGFTLVELLLVVALVGLMAALAWPRFEASQPRQLEAAARIVAADLDFARSLAVAHQSVYRVAFDRLQQQYVVTHVGADSRLDALPKGALARPGDPADQYIVRLADLPRLGSAVRIGGVLRSGAAATNVEFGPLGETTTAAASTLWLVVGSGADELWAPLTVHPVTGVARLGAMTRTRPTALAAGSTSQSGGG